MIPQFQDGWECPVCHQTRKADGFDPCIPNLPGVKYGCCGHGGKGVNEGYLYFENGVRIGFIVTSICYDDGTPSINIDMTPPSPAERNAVDIAGADQSFPKTGSQE